MARATKALSDLVTREAARIAEEQRQADISTYVQSFMRNRYPLARKVHVYVEYEMQSDVYQVRVEMLVSSATDQKNKLSATFRIHAEELVRHWSVEALLETCCRAVAKMLDEQVRKNGFIVKREVDLRAMTLSATQAKISTEHFNDAMKAVARTLQEVEYDQDLLMQEIAIDSIKESFRRQGS